MRIKIIILITVLVGFEAIHAQKTWNGSVTTNWGDANNWTPSGVPANTDDVTIGSSYTVIINTNTATCKNLVNNGTIQFLNVATRSLTVTADLSGSGTIDMTNAPATGILILQGTNNAMGTFLPGTAGTVNYNGTIGQNIAPWNYYNLTIAGIRGVNNVVLPNSGTLGIANTFTISGATFTTGQIVSTGSTINYNGNASQSIVANTAVFNYNNLTVSIPSGASSRTKTIAGVVTVGGNLVIESYDVAAICSLDPAANNLTVNGTTAINTRGSLIDGNSTGINTFTDKLTINANGNISSGNASAYIFSGGITNNGTFNISGAGNKTFSSNSQSIDGTQSITMAGNVSVSGAITVTNLNNVTLSGTLDGTLATSKWTNGNSSTLIYANGTVPFLTNGSWDMATNPNTVVYNGGTQNVRGGDYSNLTFSNNNTKTLQGPSPLNVNQTFTLAGTTSIACAAIDLNLKGAVNYTGTGTLTSGSNTVSYSNAGDQTLIPGTYSGSVVFSGSGNRNMAGNTIITNATTIPNGIILNTNNFIFSEANNLTIAQGAQLNVVSNATGSATLRMGSGRILTNNGILKIGGTATNPAIVTQYLAGTYSLVQNDPTAIIHANYYQLNYLNGGVNITAGTIDPTNNFRNGSFSNGTGAQSLLIQNIDLTGFPVVTNTVFNAGPTYNVTRTTGNGSIQFNNASGVLSGENFDNDDSNPGTHILWVFPGSTYYSNPNGTFRAGKLTDWTQNPDGSGASPASLTDGQASLIIQNGHTVTLDATNGNINVKELQIGQGTSGALVIGDNTTQRILTIQQKLDLEAGASITAGSVATPYHILQIYGNIYNQGTFNVYDPSGKNVNLEVYGVSSAIQGTLTPTLNDITFKTGTNAITSLSLDVRGNVSIENAAIFNDGNQNIVVKGNWNEAGTGQRIGNGNVTFKGSINSVNNSGGSTGCSFYNVFFSGGGAGSIQDNITVNGDFYVTNSTSVQINNYSNTLLGNFTVDFGSTFLQSANTTYFNGTLAQTLNANGSVTFNNLSFANGGGIAKTSLGSITTTGQVAILSGATADGNADFTIAGGMRLDGNCNWSGTVTAMGGTIQTYNAANTATLGTALLTVNGSVYMGYTAPATGFQLTMSNDVNIQNGYLVLQNNTSLVGQPANTLTLAAGMSLYVRGSNNFPTGFGTYTISPTSYVRYDWNIDQTVRGGNNLTYGHLVLDDNSSASTWNKTSDGIINITGYLDLNGAIVFNLNGNNLNVAGNIYNLTNCTINGPTASVFLNAPDANQTIESSGTGSYTFQNLNFTLDAGTSTRTKYIQSGTTLNLLGDLNITNINGGASIQHIVDLADISINGTPVNFYLGPYCQLNTTNPTIGINAMDKFTGTKSLDVTSTFYYSLNGTQSIADGFAYGNILFNGGTKTVEGPLDINGNITGTGGGTPTIFTDGGLTHTVAGNWNLTTANYTAASATGTIILDGVDQYITGTNFFNLTVNNTGIASQLGTVNILNDLRINDNAHFDGNTQAINLSGNWVTPGNGVFSQSTGTVNFIGSVNQTLQTNTLSNISNLTVNKPNSAGNQTVTLLSDMVVTNNTTLNTNAGILDISGRTVRMGGRLYIYGNTIETGLTFIPTGSTVIFDGASSQYIYNNNANPLTFNNVEFDGAGAKFFGWGGIAPANQLVDIKGNVVINGSSVNGSGWTYDVNINVAGDWTNNGSFSHSAARTVSFVGNNQTISASSFGSVAFTNANTKTLTGNITASGSLTIAGTATLDPGSNNINVSGNWDNSAAGAQFISTSGTVIFEGGSSTITTGTITGPATGKAFNNVTINKLTGNVATLAGDFEVKNDLIINSGYLRSNTFDLWIAGNYQNLGGVFDHNNNASVLTLNGAGGTKIFDPGNNAMTYALRGIHINAPGTTYKVGNNFIINQNQDFILDAGYFGLNAHTLQLNTNNQRIVINGGTFDVDAGSVLTFNGTTQSLLNNGGTLKIVGTSSNIASINRLAGTYTITQNSGIFHAGNYKIDYPSGITITGGNIDATNNFSDGTFSSGSGTAYLTLTGLNFGNFTVSNVVFNSGPTYNVSRTSGTGTITFADAIGTLSGENFDNDNGNPGTLINWSNLGGFYWDGGAGTDNWNDAQNWSGDVVPDATSNVYIDHKYIASATAYTVRIRTSNANAARIIMDAQGGAAITLQLEGGYDLDVNGSLIINANTTLNVNSTTSTINVAGNWANAGTFNHGNSTVTFDGNATYYTIATGGNGVGKKFYNVSINATAATYALTAALDARGNFDVNAGTFDLAAPGNNIWIGGNWNVNLVNSAVFVPNLATATFDGTDQTINNGPFYNLITATSGTKTINSNLAINGSVTIGNGTILNAQDKNIFVAVNWTNNGGSFTHSGLGTINFNGLGTQQIDNVAASTTTFNHITFSNSGGKYLNKSNTVNGNFTIDPTSGVVDVGTNQITSNSAGSFYGGNNSLFRVRGLNNFPNNFAAVNLSSSSTVEYISDIDQIIRVTPSWSYGNLRLTDATNLSAPSTKTAQAGELIITGSLTINDVRTLLDMAANSTNMTLTGNINFPTGGIQINWGTGTSTLTHIGVGDWIIDRDITGFNNLVLSGWGNKWLQGDLAITGDVTVKNGVTLRMQEGWGPPPIPHIMTGIASKTFTMENGAGLVSPVGSTATPAFAVNFGTYNLAANSTTTLNGYVDQTLYTDHGIIYGNLDLGGYSRNVTLDGIADLRINGWFNSNTAILFDNAKNMSVAGSYAYLNYYTPTAGVTFTMNGTIAQTLYDGATGVTNPTFDFSNIIFSGSGTKTFGDGNDIININGNLSIGNGVTVTSGRNITFTGLTWTNNGIFQHTGNTVTFDQTSDQTINPGTPNALNYFNNVVFSNTNTKQFIANGADFNGTFTITSGTVNLGAFTHYIGGNLTNNTGGILNSSTSNLVFDGGNQNINTPAFAVNNVTIAGNGTKRMFSNWTVNSDLVINNLAALNTSDAVIPTFYDINIKGNWTNNGTYTCNTSKVTFIGSSSPISITSNGSSFYDVDFTPTVITQYNLLSPLSRISRAMNLSTNSTLNLNSNTLILGSNIAAGKLFNIQGTLNVNENAFLKFNNQTSQSVMNVSGNLRLIGTNSTNIATLSRETAGVTGAETQINIQAGGTIAAQYYLIEYLQDAGMNLMAGSTLDPVNNFSNGKWSNIRVAANVCYLNLEANYTGGDISNICFDFSGTPTQGQHFNVRRNVTSPSITFAMVSGNLGSYLYEDDEIAIPSASTGLLRWPALTSTTWIGGLSTDWHTPGNWSGGVPTPLLDAIIPKGLPNDPHIINGNADCKNLQISTGRLSLDFGNKLTTTGDIIIGGTGANNGILSVSSPASEIVCGGFWTRGTSGMFVHGNGTVHFVSSAGSATITPLSSTFYNIVIDNPLTTFYLVGGNPTILTIKGSVDIKNGTLTPTTNNYSYNLEGDFIVENGLFTPVMGAVTAGTVNITGTGNQNITNASFHNLTISGSGTKATHGPITINNQTTVNSILKAEAGSNIDFNGNVVINASGTFNDGDETHTFTGITWTGTGAYVGAGTIKFDRTTSDQSVTDSKFNNIDISCTGRNLTITGNVAITGDAVVRNGVANLYVNNYLLSSSSASGTFTVEGASGIIITGADHFPSGFSSYNMANTSTSYYRGTINQLVAGVNYGILTLQNTNIKTLKGDIGIQNNLNFNTATLDVSPNNYTINISGNWSNSSTGTFIPGNGEVVFDGNNASQSITTAATATNPFWDIRVNKALTTGQVIAGSAVTYTIKNNLTVENGKFHANGRPINVGNDLIASGTGNFVQSGTYTMTKATGTANLQSNGSIFNSIIINAGASATINAMDNLRNDGNFTVQSGTFNGNGKRITLGLNLNTISISGVYQVGSGGIMEIGYNCNLSVNSGGTIEIIGTSGNAASITRNVNNWTGNYRFTVDGTIKAKYALFEYMGGQSNGIYITANGTIDPANNFSSCTFNNGVTTGAMLTIENTQSFTGANAIFDVTFPTSPGGSAKNVRKTVSTTGIIEFYNATGVFAGENFDDDPFNIINWTGPITLTWNGSINTDWFNASNWTASSGPGFVPTGVENVFIAPALNQPILTTNGATTAHLTIKTGAVLTLNTPLDGGATDLDIKGDLIITGTLQEASANDFLTVEGNWTRTGITQLNGNITFSGTGTSKIINNGNYPFYNLIIGGNAQYKINTGTIIKNDLIINAGAYLETPAYSQLFVGGSWNNNGTFYPSTGKITFNAISGTNNINGGGSPFYDVDINAGADYNLTGTLSLNRTLTINGSLNLNGQTLNAGDGNGVDYLNVNGTLTASANSNLRMGASSYLQVNSGGILQLVGTDADHPAYLTHQTGYYAVDIASGGTLAARFFNADYLNSNGIYMHNGALLDPLNNLSDGTFSQGTAGGTYLKFENDFGGNITIANDVFNSGPQYNVTRTTGNDLVTFRDAAGTIGTYLFENDQTGIADPNTGLILWTYVNSYIWTGAIDHNWHNTGNWTTNIIPDDTKSAIIPNVPNNPVISTGSASTKRLTLYTGALLNINGQDLIIADNVVNDGTITVAGNPVISVAGSWGGTTGTFNSGNSKVLFNATGGNKTIALGTGNFYDFEINAAASATYQFAATTQIRNNLGILSGSLDGSAFDLTVGGNWISTGTFIPGLHTVTLSASSGTISIDNGSNNFYNLMVNSGGGTGNATFVLVSPLMVSNNYTLHKGNFDLSNDGGASSQNMTIGNRLIVNGGNLSGRAATITVGENWQISSPGTFTCGTSTVNMVSTAGTKSITPGFSPFYNLIINSGGIYRLSNNTLVGNNLNITSGTLDVSLSPSYNISVGGSWTDNGSFIPRVGTVTFNGTSQSISKASDESFYNLVITNNTQLSILSGNVLATNALTYTSGIVTTGINKLTVGTSIANPGTFNYTAGRIVGQLERWITSSGTDYVFPVGNTTDNENLTLRPVSGFSQGSVLVSFVSADPGFAGLPVSESGVDITRSFTEGYWNVLALNGMACTNYNLTLMAQGFVSHSLNNDTRILKRTNGGNWMPDGTHAIPANPNYYRNALNGLSSASTQFCLGDIDCIPGTIGNNQSVCIGNVLAPMTSIIVPRGGDGVYLYTWQYTTNATAVPGDGNWTDIPASNTPDYTPTGLTNTTYFVRKVSGTGCASDKFTNKLSIIILPLPTSGETYRKPNI